MKFKIYPPIGIARLGNSLNSFYVGPEIPGHPGFESDGQGGERAVTQYKVSPEEAKRQAARFRLFEIPDGSTTPRPAQLPANSTVEWTVHLVNKKGAVKRNSTPPSTPVRPQLQTNSAARVIDPQPRTIQGANASGVKFDTGTFDGRQVPLGELQTDRNQNLLVLGGFGFSSSPTNTTLGNSFYVNPGWHDDVSDGPVTARIRLADGTVISDVAPAWVSVAPPDFAPEIQGIVTLYDILLQLGVTDFGMAQPAPISFTQHVFPILHRTSMLQWVNQDPNWASLSDNWADLANSSTAAAQLRRDNADVARASILSHFKLTEAQESILAQWVAGSFQSDWVGIPQPGNAITADGMVRAALDGTVGQGFFPGIEIGIIMKDKTLYSAPFDFRIDHGSVSPGDLTALMAQPWQADFLKCSQVWWPSQRPDDVLVSVTSTDRKAWDRGINTHLQMVHNFSRLGFITARHDGQGNTVFVEDQRAQTSSFT